jgi:hypothetical protein
VRGGTRDTAVCPETASPHADRVSGTWGEAPRAQAVGEGEVWCVSGSGAGGRLIFLSLLAWGFGKTVRWVATVTQSLRPYVRAAITSRSARVSRTAGGNALRAQPELVGGGGKGGGSSGERRTRSAMVKQNFLFWQKVQYFFGKTAGAGMPRRSRGSPRT